MNRNISIDVLKGILILLVIVIHICASYENPTWGIFVQYLYSMASYAVPIFFIISGYYFFNSENKDKNILKLISMYLILCYTYLLIQHILFGTDFIGNFMIIYSIDKSCVGYLWFVKYLIYFHLISYLIIGENKKYKILVISLLIINILFLINGNISTTKFRYLNFIPYVMGLLIARYDKNFTFESISKKVFCITLIFLPFTVFLEYVAAIPMLYIISPIVFIIAKNTNIKYNYIQYFTNNSVYILAFHGLFILFVREYNLTEKNWHFITLYVLVVVCTIVVIYLFKKSLNKILRWSNGNKIFNF